MAHASVSCGADAVHNTAAILCSGASVCSDTAVVVDENIDVESGECVFDLGGRDVTLSKTFQIDGVTGLIEIDHAHDVTIASTGKLKARGDFPSRPAPGAGGRIRLFATGVIEHRGVIDASGNAGGEVRLVADGDVSVLGNSQIIVNGISTSAQGHAADAGEIVIEATTGGVAVAGSVELMADSGGRGGTLAIQAATSISVTKAIDATGGALGGGAIELVAGDDVTATKTLDVDSVTGGGSGGTITMRAGADDIGGAIGGGSVEIEGPLLLNGSSSGSAGGNGGVLDIKAAGDIRVAGANAQIHANADASFAGSGGEIILDSADENPYVIGPRDGDIVLGGVVTTRGGNSGGHGGAITLTAGTDLFFDADTEMHGRDSGGEFAASAGGAVTINRELAADATNVAGRGGEIAFTAGLARNAGLILKENITVEAVAGLNGDARKITLAGCTLTIEPDTRIDADADTAVGAGHGGVIELVARAPIQILAMATFFARPGGAIVLTHPPGQAPVIAGSASFNPAPTDNVVTDGPLPNCPVCGDGVLQLGEVCEPMLDPCCNQTCSATACAAPTPSPTPTAVPGQLGLPDPVAAKAADKCQQMFTKATVRFLTAKLNLVEACADTLLACIQTKREAGGKRAQCLEKARTKCDARLRKIGAAQLAFGAAVQASCGPGGLGALTAANGLAFAGSGDCGASATLAGFIDCVSADEGCRADELFDRGAPRTAELLRVAGVAPDAVAAVACLDDHGGDGVDLDLELDGGKRVLKCGHAIAKGATHFATRSLKGLAKCVGKIFTCVQTRPGAVTACVVPKVVDTCRAEFARFNAAKAKLSDVVTKSCGAVPYASMLAAAEGLNLGPIDCSATTVPAFAECLADATACRVGDLLRVDVPRTDEMLALFGLTLPTGVCAVD